jgi:hypothetical protein
VAVVGLLLNVVPLLGAARRGAGTAEPPPRHPAISEVIFR